MKLDISAASYTKSPYNLLPNPPPILVISKWILSKSKSNKSATTFAAYSGVCTGPTK